MILLPIEDEKSFKKDLISNALLNTDRASLAEHKNRKLISNRVDDLSDQINNMKSDISDIKSLLIQLVNSKEK